MTTSHSAVVTLHGDREIVITREFAAPRHLVWRAISEPELVKRWWNAKRGEVTLAEIDLRVGGRWRYLMITPDGLEVGFHGEYREITEPERLVTTEVFEMPGVPPEALEAGAAINTLTLEDLGDGRTAMTVHVLHAEPAHRDAHIGSGMEAGMQDAYDLLEDVARSLA